MGREANQRTEFVIHCRTLLDLYYLTIRIRAADLYHAIEIESEQSNCFRSSRWDSHIDMIVVVVGIVILT